HEPLATGDDVARQVRDQPRRTVRHRLPAVRRQWPHPTTDRLGALAYGPQAALDLDLHLDVHVHLHLSVAHDRPQTVRPGATMRSGFGGASGRLLPLGVGAAVAPPRTTGARSASGQASATAATISAPSPPVTHASCAVTRRPVRRTEPTTDSASSGCIE